MIAACTMFEPLIIIPARMASTRLPGKPLAQIAGQPMILHVVARAVESRVGRVVVAAGDQEIVDTVRQAGVEVVLTRPDHPSGSDRVHEALQIIDPQGRHDVVINLQGDLPLVEPADLQRVLEPLEDPDVALGTLVAEVTSAEEATSNSVVKVACSFAEEAGSCARALYFSRQPIPWGAGPLWHHVGIYAWRRDALARFVALPPSALEQRESLEQLRVLEAGMTISCARTDRAPHGVDTLADLEFVRRIVEGRVVGEAV